TPAAPTDTTTSSNAPAHGASGATPTAAPTEPMCGLTVFASSDASNCQKLLDTSCCDIEKVCAGQPECRALLAKVKACPSRKGAETNECLKKAFTEGSSTPGYSALNRVSVCLAQKVPDDSKCDLPRMQ